MSDFVKEEAEKKVEKVEKEAGEDGDDGDDGDDGAVPVSHIHLYLLHSMLRYIFTVLTS